MTKLEKSSEWASFTITYCIDTGSDGNLLPVSLFRE